MIDFTGLVDIKIVIILLLLGGGLKHLKFLVKINNKAIPMILIVLGLGLSIYLSHAFTLTSFLIGIVSASLAVGIHSSGKNFWELISMSLTNNTYMANPNTITNGASSQEKVNVTTGTSKGIAIPSSAYWGEEVTDTTNAYSSYENCVGGVYMGTSDVQEDEEIIYGIDDSAVG